MRRLSICGAMLLGALSACGPAGTISGRVEVEGGSAGGIAVIIYGPESAATVTDMDGKFSVTKLPDGVYVVRATLRSADVEEVSVSTTVTNGTASPEPVLNFRASTARVTGRVVMTDGSSPIDLTVTATGPETRGSRTAADGSFTFENLKTGAYVVSVEGPDTLEGRVAIGVNASGTGGNVGDLRLTPVGRINGTVSYNAMPVANAPVVVTGSNTSSVTDAMGRFSLVNVPTGNQAVLVRVGTAPFFRSATAMLQVARGLNPDLPMTLTDDAPATGTVSGTVTFHGPRSPRDITVSAPGTGVTATPQANGTWQLMLPVGVWDIVANAPQHPTLNLGRVTVLEGAVQTLPGAELSWYRPLWRSSPAITGALTEASGASDTNPWSLITFSDATPRLALVNSVTGDFRIVAASNSSLWRISRLGKYAAWVTEQTVFVYEIATAALQTFTVQNPSQPQTIARIEFSTDESALFIQRNISGPGGVTNLQRIKFATPNSPETFPPSGSASIFFTTADRWFVRDVANSVRLVTPASDFSGVFTNVSTFSATPTAWALTNCAATCELYVLGPTSTSPALRDTSINPLPNTILNFTSSGLDNRADYPCFTNTSNGTAFCVNSTTAAHINLAAPASTFRLNEAGDRVIWSFQSGANVVLREEEMPPSTGTTNLDSNTVGWTVGWISPTRAYGFENSGSPRELHLIRAGTLTTESDVGAQLITARPPLLVFPHASTSQWRAILGDGAVRQIPVATNIPVANVSVRPLGTGMNAVTRYASVAFDQVSSYILDEPMNMVRLTSAGVPAALNGLRSGSFEFFDLTRLGGPRAFYVYNTNALLEWQENSIALKEQIGAPGVASFIGLGADQRTIYIAGFQP